MTPSLIDADSLLAIDVGTINTRAMLFDVVDGRYRFVAVGSSPSTAGAPYRDIGEGVHRAVERLQEVTGRILLGSDARLIIPAQGGGGVDACVATLSAGKPMRVMAVGLLENVSAESAQNLASTTYAQVVETLSLNDRRKPAARIDAIVRLRPDLIIVAGGTEGGASRSVMNLLEPIGLACYLLPEGTRPEVLYVGNQALTQEVKSALDTVASLHLAPNIRPTLEVEQLAPAQVQLTQIFRLVRSRQIGGVQELDLWTGGSLTPTGAAFGRMINLLSRIYAPRGVLGVDVGASATVAAAAFSGELTLGVYPRFGLGEGLAGFSSISPLEEILRWLPVEMTENTVRDYLHNKALYPASLPLTAEELALEQALARQMIYLSVRKVCASLPLGRAPALKAGLLPWFDPLVGAGSVLTAAPTRGQSLLMMLDGIQPTRTAVMTLDQNNLLAALGVAALRNPTLAVQVLESGVLLDLGTVISPVGHAPYGTPCLRLKITYPSGDSANLDVKNGALELLPLGTGQKATLQLTPLNAFDVGNGPGRSIKLGVRGGVLGSVIIDARGRPLRLPADADRRRELHRKWLATLGG